MHYTGAKIFALDSAAVKVQEMRSVWPLYGSNHKISAVAPFLLDCSGLLPIPGHVIGVSQRHKRGNGVCLIGPKETQPLCFNNSKI